MFTKSELEKIKELIFSSKKIVIVTHHNPDGDAIGSSLGLYHFLKNWGIQSKVIVPNEFPKFLKWLPDAKKIEIAEYRLPNAFEEIINADLLFILDFNTAKRSEYLQEAIEKTKAKTVLIDHHQSPDKFDFVYSDVNIPATCQMVYQFIEALDETQLINKEVATSLYTGIMTDTGGFRYRNTTAQTHKITGDLIDKGAEPDIISSNVLDSYSFDRVRLLGKVLDGMEYLPEYQTTITYLKRNELKNYNFQKGDTEGFVNFGLTIYKTKLTAFFMEDLKYDFIKISFRSKGDFDVNDFARKYFDGGGHVNAAGGRSELSLEDTIIKFKKCLEEQLAISS